MNGQPPADMPPDAARAYRDLVEEPAGPIWTHPREDRLTRDMRAQVRSFAALVASSPPAWAPGEEPAWLPRWLADVWPRLPARSEHGPLPPRLIDIPPLRRDDLAADPAVHVPAGVDLDNLIAFSTSGTAGAPTAVPSHPVTNASYIPLILHAARPVVDLQLRPDHLDWVTLTSQDIGGFIIPSWSSITRTLTAQVSLRPHGWLAEGDCGAFLARHDPRCITGDPVAFDELLTLDPDIHPQLLVSTASTLADGLRARLQDRFGAPVADIYSLTEAGPVAVSLTAAAAGEAPGPATTTHHLLQPRLFVEVLRGDGSRAAPEEVGEIVLTGGMNQALPLIRYATGDFGSLRWTPDARAPHIADLQGRAPVLLTTRDGRAVNSHSVTVALRPLALPRFSMHQHAPGHFRLSLDQVHAGQAMRIRELLATVLGVDAAVEVVEMADHPVRHTGPKVQPFTTAAAASSAP